MRVSFHSRFQGAEQEIESVVDGQPVKSSGDIFSIVLGRESIWSIMVIFDVVRKRLPGCVQLSLHERNTTAMSAEEVEL